MNYFIVILFYSFFLIADETVHFTATSTAQGILYNEVKSATYLNHRRTHINDHPFNALYSKYNIEFDTLIATKYPTMTFYIGEDETLLTSSVDNNCTVPFNLPNSVKGIDITPACRAHDYCYMNNSRFSVDLNASFEKCNEDFYQDLLKMCEKRFFPLEENNSNEDCEECNAHLLESAIGSTFSFIDSIEQTYAQMSRSFHRSGCETDMYLISQSVGVAGYSTFLASQERAAQFTLDLVRIARAKPEFESDIEEITGVSLKEMVHGYVNYCFSIKAKGFGEGYEDKTLATYAGDVYEGFEVEKDLGNYSACSDENKILIESFIE